MIENTILKRRREGRRAVTLGLTFHAPALIEWAAATGFDAINLDGEHGAFAPESVDEICGLAHAYGMSVTARVSNIRSDTINLYLDRGVQGITGPHVESKEEAQALADACLFPPDGKRSWGGGRGTEFNDDVRLAKYGGKPGFAKWANANMIVQAQIESKKAWDNLDGILSVRGLTGVAGGPNDFAASLGHPGEPDHPERVAASADVEKRARSAGKTAGGGGGALMVHATILAAGREFVAKHRGSKLPR